MNKQPNHLGELIHEQKDDVGLITIYQNHNLRYLTFGNRVEQSCLTLDRPYRLEHAYTQAMMLGLLLKRDIRSALLLGLGGGSLARALHHAYPKLKINAVEYRQAIIDIAQQFFEVPDNKYLRFHCEDAQHYLDTDDNQYDLVFTDLFLPDGVHESQLSSEFFNHCRNRLTENGILLVNQWSSDFQITKLARDALNKIFEDKILNLHVHGGNNIAFAFNGNFPALKRKSFFEAAQKMALKLDIPLQKLARNFWQQNAEAIQIGQYKNS